MPPAQARTGAEAMRATAATRAAFLPPSALRYSPLRSACARHVLAAGVRIQGRAGCSRCYSAPTVPRVYTVRILQHIPCKAVSSAVRFAQERWANTATGRVATSYASTFGTFTIGCTVYEARMGLWSEVRKSSHLHRPCRAQCCATQFMRWAGKQSRRGGHRAQCCATQFMRWAGKQSRRGGHRSNVCRFTSERKPGIDLPGAHNL